MGCCGSAQNEDKNSANTKAGSKQDGGETKTVQSKKAGMEKYELLKVLGTGASCEVHCVKEKETGKMYAMKIMQKSQPYNKTLYETEIAVLALLSHPNLIEMAEHFDDKKAFYIVSAFYRGGELFDRVQKGSFSERDASRLAKEMLLGLGYCHKKNVVHRDLKPENFVFETAEADSHMKLIDFGCAKHVEDDELVLDYAGSPYYVAPEVLKADAYKRTGKIWKAADMWSVGVIIFLLVCGWPPFNGRNQKEIFDCIAMGKYRFPSAKEHPLSESVKGLIRSLLVMDPLKRATAEQCLQHPWIAGDDAPKNPLPESVVKGLSSFQSQCRLKKAVARGMANRMTPDDKASLAGVFKRFDLNGDGKLGPDEIAAMMRFLGQAEVDAKEVMKHLDENQDGSISQEEFATAQTLGKLESSNEQKNAFALVDKDKDGFVSRQELEDLCNINPDAAKALISDVDVNKDGRISLDEWLTAMNNEAAKKKQKSRTSNAPQPSQA